MAEPVRTPRVLVVGAGGIGGIVTATLREHDPSIIGEVVALTTNVEIARATEDQGFRLTGEGGDRVVPGRAVTALEPGSKFEWILLCTQPPQVEAAARSALPHLAEGGAMVCFQNGLCETRVARVLEDAGVPSRGRVVGAVVAWGAAMPEPGLYERTSAGGFTIGLPGGEVDPRLEQLALLLEAIGPVVISKNLLGARWSKLAINCAISTIGTLAGVRLGSVLIHRFARRLALDLMTEAVAVARAEKVRLEKVSGTLDLDWIALTDTERRAAGSPGLIAKHAMLLAVGARYRKMRSSMLTAIERGRPPAVDFLNGEVVSHAARHGIETPFNAEAQRLVHAIARKELPPAMSTLRRLADPST